MNDVNYNEEKSSLLGRIKAYLDKHNRSDHKVNIPDGTGFSWRKLFAFMGPGILVSIAYIDPGNFTTDITAGADFNYRLIWVLVFATFMGLILQALSAKLGLVTGRHLAQVCREEYGNKHPITILMWLITESAIIASDIPEVIGTAFALYMLFGLPLWAGVLITGVDTMLFLAIQFFGVRYLEFFIGALVAIISSCFIVELGMSPIDWKTPPNESHLEWCDHFNTTTTANCPVNYSGGFFGGFIPRLSPDAIYIAISLLGSVIMPHNLYLHSALVLSRGVKRTKTAIAEANLYNWIECAFALIVSCFVNIAILAVAAANFYPNDDNHYSQLLSDPDLDDTSRLLGNTLGKAARIVFGIALLASGQSSTLTGTYAGQFVMEGFVELKFALWKRNLITRSFAIAPSLIVALVAGQKGSTTLIILSSAILSFQLPFALVPLIKFTSSKIKMGPFANSKFMTVFLSLLALMIVAANIDLIYETLFGSGGSIITMHHVGLKIFLSILVGVVGILYLAFLLYLVFIPVKVSGFHELVNDPEQSLLDGDDNNGQSYNTFIQ